MFSSRFSSRFLKVALWVNRGKQHLMDIFLVSYYSKNESITAEKYVLCKYIHVQLFYTHKSKTRLLIHLKIRQRNIPTYTWVFKNKNVHLLICMNCFFPKIYYKDILICKLHRYVHAHMRNDMDKRTNQKRLWLLLYLILLSKGDKQ